MSAEEIEASLLAAVDKCPVQSDPFDHICTEDLLPQELYPQILEHLPPDEYYGELKHPQALREDGSSTRLQLTLGAERVEKLPEPYRNFWHDVRLALHSTAGSVWR